MLSLTEQCPPLAFPVDHTARDPQRFHGAGPALVRAPEALLWLDLTPAIDIWAVGCMVRIIRLNSKYKTFCKGRT